MSMVMSKEGRIRALRDFLGRSILEDWMLCLFNADITPNGSESLVAFFRHEAMFDNYQRKRLIREIGPHAWNEPVLKAPSGEPAWTNTPIVGHSEYGSAPQEWTCGRTGDTIYGYFIFGVKSKALICSERFKHPRTIYEGDVLSIKPVFENA